MPASIAQHARIKRFSFIFLASPLSVVRKFMRSRICGHWGPNIADKGSVFLPFQRHLFRLCRWHTPLSGMDGRAEYNRTGIGLPDFYICLTVTQLWIALDDELLKQLSEKNTASDRGCRVSDQPPFRSQQQGLRLYASSRKQKNRSPLRAF